jgi:hypothetical protein
VDLRHAEAAQLAADAVAAADLTPDQLADVVCVGGTATSGTAVAAVAAALGREPVVPDDPGTAIVRTLPFMGECRPRTTRTRSRHRDGK